MSLERTLSACVVVVTTVAVTPKAHADTLDGYFNKKGLVRLSPIRDDVHPGRIILGEGIGFIGDRNSIHFGDHILEYTTNTYALAPLTAGTAVFEGLTSERAVEGSLALKLVEQLIPASISGKVSLTGEVQLKQFEAQVRTLDPALRGAILRDGQVSNALVAKEKADLKPFIVLEAYAVKKFSVVEKAGKTLETSLKVSGELDLGGEGNFKITRSSESSLTIEGDRYFVVAVRAVRVEIKNGATTGQVDEADVLSRHNRGRSIPLSD